MKMVKKVDLIRENVCLKRNVSKYRVTCDRIFSGHMNFCRKIAKRDAKASRDKDCRDLLDVTSSVMMLVLGIIFGVSLSLTAITGKVVYVVSSMFLSFLSLIYYLLMSYINEN